MLALVTLLSGSAASPISAAQTDKTADYSFRYQVPPAATRVPGLAAWLEADRRRVRAAVARDAAAGRREAARGGFPFRPYESEQVWQVVTETPRLLSLSGRSYGYTGGAHGSSGATALIWDKAGQQRLNPKDLFVSTAAIQAATRTSYCAALDRQRKARGSWSPGAGPFGGCPVIKELTLLLGSSTKRRIDRIALVADPYVAGSYAEGFYEVTLPVTAPLLAAVRPAWRDAFALGR